MHMKKLGKAIFYAYKLFNVLYYSAFFTNNQCDSITTQLCHHLRRCENKLKAMEQSNNIIQRWTKTCPQYQEVKVLLTSQKRTCLLLKMEQVARERWFLLTLKAKYAG